MNDEIWKAYSHGMAAAMQEGGIYVSSMLLHSYSQLGLSNSEAMLMLQMMQFAQVEHIEFPTPEQLADRMGLPVQDIGAMLSRLMRDGYIAIDDFIDPVSGVQSERYNWSGWLLQASHWHAEHRRMQKKQERSSKPRPQSSSSSQLFSSFEQEFGRLLSPMECETISAWLDQDRYTEEIILFALKEAVFAGKLSMRYIDRILMEWGRNRITSVEEAKVHTQKFRAGRL